VFPILVLGLEVLDLITFCFELRVRFPADSNLTRLELCSVNFCTLVYNLYDPTFCKVRYRARLLEGTSLLASVDRTLRKVS
jgi:hypothetical protein